ncbi:type II toxin-antitoxin system VapC family toxin [Neorhizobium vignae]|uniref:type II toxin-antitoxin system VapC family toxin n=1 Tax=Neorhizobium vignae TaxID=690585 RepID=UPI00056522E1|nr:type II toxin-antitoxin system VapC family toxin [Neorhizobium vignae]
MVIDTSAIVAIRARRAAGGTSGESLVANPIRLLPVTCVLETRMVMVSRRGEHALAEIDLWLSKIGAKIIPVDVELVDLATQAWLTYGKGRHPAGLNFADCFSYALAKRADDALLFIGEDFRQTDIETA